ncbi:MAG TPA: VanZ family protein, partial [Porticoccaceae bacterium]
GWMSAAQRWLLLFVPMMAFGVVTEVLQLFVPGRGADPLDLVADAVGAAMGMAFAVRQIKQSSPV